MHTGSKHRVCGLIQWQKNGTDLMTIDVKKGAKRIEVDASLLNAGNYFYCLVVEVQKVESKKLIIVK